MSAKMAIQFKLCLCLFLAFSIICSARNTISISGGDEIIIMRLKLGGRSLKMSLDDYDDASANSGHDPGNGNGGGDHGDGGRGRDRGRGRGRGGRRAM